MVVTEYLEGLQLQKSVLKLLNEILPGGKQPQGMEEGGQQETYTLDPPGASETLQPKLY